MRQLRHETSELRPFRKREAGGCGQGLFGAAIGKNYSGYYFKALYLLSLNTVLCSDEI